MAEAFMNALQWFYEWAMEHFISWARALQEIAINALKDLIPESLLPSIAALKPYFDIADLWVPLTEGLTLLAVYLLIAQTKLFLSWVLRLIPGL